MSKMLKIWFISLSILVFIGCGEDEKEDKGFSIQPITKKNSCGYSGTIQGEKATFNSATDGDIRISCEKEKGINFSRYTFVNNVNSLTIIDTIKVRNIIAKGDILNASILETFNYKKGTIDIKSSTTLNGKKENFDCIETYPSPLPTTLLNEKSALALLKWKPNKSDRIKTTCPESYYQEYEYKTNVEIDSIENYTLTDSEGKKHLLYLERNYLIEIDQTKKNDNEVTYSTPTKVINSQNNQNGLSSYTKDGITFVKLSSKSSSCDVSYDIRMNYLDSTTCLNIKDSNEVELFCTKDKSLCKKHSEVIFFNITNEDLTTINISKEAPFVGERYYNFMGGSGTNESISIDKNGYVSTTFTGIYDSSTIKIGEYEIFLKDYFIYKDFICTQEEKGSMLCTYLN